MLETLAFAIILLCVAGRTFLNEVPFRGSEFMAIGHVGVTDPQLQLPAERIELARVTFAVLLLVAAALWAWAGAIRGVVLQRPLLTVLVLAFAALSLVSALKADNLRWALDSYIEQVSLLIMTIVAAQLMRDPARLRVAVLMIAAVVLAAAVAALWETFVDIPERIAAFNKDPQKYLAQMGIAPDSPQAIAYKARAMDRAPIGFVSLSNVLASILLVGLAVAAGLAVDQLRKARAEYAAFKAAASRGQLHTPTLRAIALLIICVPAAAALVLTRSRGGIIAAAFALAVGGAVLVWRDALSRHFRKTAIVVLALLVLAAGGVAAYGISHDSLPTKTMTFRWFYWEASAQMVAENPAWGVGPAGFSTAYLPLRDVRAEEAVKNPHNVIMHALAEYGLPAGLCFLAFLGVGLYLACRPSKSPVPSSERAKVHWWLWVFGAAAAVLATRAIFAGFSSSSIAMFSEAVLPAVLLAICGAIVGLLGKDFLAGQTSVTGLRIALGCAAGGFLLHELINFGLFMPSSAGLFYLALAAALVLAPPARQERKLPRLASVGIAVAVSLAMVPAMMLLWLPVQQRTHYTQKMVNAMHEQDHAGVATWAKAAAEADGLDPIAAADSARAYRGLYEREQSQASLQQAIDWSELAVKRERTNPAWHRLAANTYMATRPDDAAAVDKALNHLRQAVELDPQDLHLRIEYAMLLMQAGQRNAAISQIDRAGAIDRALLPGSAYKLNQQERQQIEQLRKQFN